MVKRQVLIGLTLMLMTAVFISGPALAEDEKPARGFYASLNFPGMTIGADEEIKMDLVVRNIGRSAETIYLDVVEKPEGWNAEIRSSPRVWALKTTRRTP